MCQRECQKTVPSAGIGLPEEAAPAIHAQVGLHALKAAHAVVQDGAGWVYREALSKGPDLWPAPASPLHMLDCEQVVCERLPKAHALQGTGPQHLSHSPKEKICGLSGCQVSSEEII